MMLAALIGSVFPDIDMLYFHLIDGRQTHHHYYITHWPLLYVFTLFVSASVWRRSPRLSSIGMMFSAATLVHMGLDSVAAPINWMAPFSQHTIELVSVPATHPNWIVSFVTHWTFALEISICAAALLFFVTKRRMQRS